MVRDLALVCRAPLTRSASAGPPVKACTRTGAQSVERRRLTFCGPAPRRRASGTVWEPLPEEVSPLQAAQRPWTARCRTVLHPDLLLRRKRGKRHMDEERIQMVVDYYKATDTPYLLMLYTMSDHSDEAYEAFRRLLTERHVAIPPPSAARQLSARRW